MNVSGSSSPVLSAAASHDPNVDQTPWQLVVATVLFVCLSILVLYYLHGRYQNMRTLIEYADSLRKTIRMQERAQQRSRRLSSSNNSNEPKLVSQARATTAPNAVDQAAAQTTDSDKQLAAAAVTLSFAS